MEQIKIKNKIYMVFVINHVKYLKNKSTMNLS